MSKTKVIPVAVACRNASGMADMPVFQVTVPPDHYDLGEHYDIAEAMAAEAGYEGPFVCFDPTEQPAIRAGVARLQPADPASDDLEDAITQYLEQRIMDGDLLAEDVSRRMARYGLMDSGAFAAEMRERMGMDPDAYFESTQEQAAMGEG